MEYAGDLDALRKWLHKHDWIEVPDAKSGGAGHRAYLSPTGEILNVFLDYEKRVLRVEKG